MADRKIMYHAWKAMRARCFSKTHVRRKYWGGRGITICERWNDFEAFFEDMKENHKQGLSLDRIDNDGNYEPGNCRWATPKQQANNKRWNRNITYNGITKNVSQWAEYLGIKRTTLSSRVHNNWSIERCLTKGVSCHSAFLNQ